jgi:2-amino-4-hydroxy-6-hydroxymethyldihydropteridine diphosphokinase
MSRAWIGLGGNLDDPATRLRRTVAELDHVPTSRLVRSSGLYGSRPVGPADQPDFINAVAELDTDLSPLMLLDELQGLEQQAGRVRTRQWGERTLDLDILLFDDRVVDTARLRIPHPELANRGFVLVPLAEIAPAIRLPDGRRVDTLRAACDDQGVWYHGPVEAEGASH